jgi:SDR family mycofactocin-dependent oxidoreductase
VGKMDGKVVFVTGGARGQGRSHALTFADAGADIVMFDNCEVDVEYQTYPGGSLEQFQATKSEVEAKGRGCLAIQGDVRRLDDLQKAVAQALEAFGHVDVCLASAGVAFLGDKVGDMDPGNWQTTLDINLTGVFNTIKAVVNHMADRRSGVIIATSSMGGRVAFQHSAHYNASKWGVIGLVKTVAAEYGPFGIRVNTVCPTNVNSPMLHNANTYKMFAPELENPTWDDVKPRMSVNHSLPIAYVEPYDISNAMLFLASDDARFITGEALTVSAGWIAQNVA